MGQLGALLFTVLNPGLGLMEYSVPCHGKGKYTGSSRSPQDVTVVTSAHMYFGESKSRGHASAHRMGKCSLAMCLPKREKLILQTP